LDEAIARYRQATDQDAEYALAYYNLGLAYWAKGRPNRAASAFRAAARTADNVPLAVQVDQRLRELAQAERSSDQGAGPLPPPLELGAIVDSGGVAPRDLDPAVARRIWLRLATGGVAMLLLAISAWAFVTTVVLSYLVQA
jgi:tetratricopeptide (TPR) repeat protein